MTLPSGTKACNCKIFDFVPLITTHCFLLDKYDSLHFNKLPVIPILFSLYRRLLCQSLLIAFVRLRKTLKT